MRKVVVVIFMLLLGAVAAASEKEMVKVKALDTQGDPIENAFVFIDVPDGRDFGGNEVNEEGYYELHAPTSLGEGFTLKVCAYGYSSKEEAYSSLPAYPIEVTLESVPSPEYAIKGYAYERPYEEPSATGPATVGEGTPLADVPLIVKGSMECGPGVELARLVTDEYGHFSAKVKGDVDVCTDYEEMRYHGGCAHFSLEDKEEENNIYTSKRYTLEIETRDKSGRPVHSNIKRVVTCTSGYVRANAGSQLDLRIKDPESVGSCDILAYTMFAGGRTTVPEIEWGITKVSVTMDREIEDISEFIPELSEDSIRLYKGWNLVPMADFERGTCPGDPNYVFIWYPEAQQYLRGSELENEPGEEMKASIWYYSTVPCQTPVGREYIQGVAANDLRLSAGWNLLFVTRDMVGHSLRQMKGSCDILKSAVWDPSIQSWQKIGKDFAFPDVYSGFVIKADSECKFELGPKPIEDIPGFEFLGSGRNSMEDVGGTEVSYSRGGGVFKVVFLAVTKDELEKLFAQGGAPKGISVESVVADGTAYDVYYISDTRKTYLWYHDSWFFLGGADFSPALKSEVLDVVEPYIAKYPPTDTLDFLQVLPSAPSFGEVP